MRCQTASPPTGTRSSVLHAGPTTQVSPGTLISVDLTDRNATERALEGLAEHYAFDGVVYNAGFVLLAGVEAIDLDDLEASFRHNLTSAVQTVQALLPGMRNQGWGRIVNLSSLVVLGVANRTAYAAAKAAMMSFTRTWALELAQTGITVNAVAPGPTATNASRVALPNQLMKVRQISMSSGRSRGAIPLQFF